MAFMNVESRNNKKFLVRLSNYRQLKEDCLYQASLCVQYHNVSRL
jgi:hypothetical protein